MPYFYFATISQTPVPLSPLISIAIEKLPESGVKQSRKGGLCHLHSNPDKASELVK